MKKKCAKRVFTDAELSEIFNPMNPHRPQWVQFWISVGSGLLLKYQDPLNDKTDYEHFGREIAACFRALQIGDCTLSPLAKNLMQDAAANYEKWMIGQKAAVEAKKKAKKDAAKEQLKRMIEADKARKNANTSIKVDGVDVNELPY